MVKISKSEENFVRKMEALRAEVEAAEKVATPTSRARAVEVMPKDIPVSGLMNVSRLYRERLIRAGFTTVQKMLAKWRSEELYRVFGGHCYRISLEIESELYVRGFEIKAHYELCCTAKPG